MRYLLLPIVAAFALGAAGCPDDTTNAASGSDATGGADALVPGDLPGEATSGVDALPDVVTPGDVQPELPRPDIPPDMAVVELPPDVVEPELPPADIPTADIPTADSPTADSPTDVPLVDVPPDTATEIVDDVPPDAEPDVEPDLPPDVEPDVPADGGTDADVLADAGPDVPEPGCPVDDGPMVYVPAGDFLGGSSDEVHATGAYCIHVREVAAQSFNACVAEGGCDGYDEWSLCQTIDASSPNQCQPNKGLHPANWIDWYRALAYCEHVGMRLPTADEWEKAARGTDGRTYPWGDTITCADAHWGRAGVFDECSGAGGLDDLTAPVTSYADVASPYGALNLVGNVREWLEFRDDLTAPPDPAGFAASKGGSYSEGEFLIEPSATDTLLGPGVTTQGHGFRCVAEPLAVPALPAD